MQSLKNVGRWALDITLSFYTLTVSKYDLFTLRTGNTLRCWPEMFRFKTALRESHLMSHSLNTGMKDERWRLLRQTEGRENYKEGHRFWEIRASDGDVPNVTVQNGNLFQNGARYRLVICYQRYKYCGVLGRELVISCRRYKSRGVLYSTGW